MHKETLLLFIAFLFFIGVLFLLFFIPQKIEQTKENKESFDSAIEKNDVSYCEKIKGISYKECPETEECLPISREVCYYQLALKNNALELCNNAGEFKPLCLDKLSPREN